MSVPVSSATSRPSVAFPLIGAVGAALLLATDWTLGQTAIALALFLLGDWLIVLYGRSPVRAVQASSIVLALLAVAVLGVPLSWSLGILAPWPEVVAYGEIRAVGTGLAFLLCFTLGLIVGGALSGTSVPVRYVQYDRALGRTLAITVLISVFAQAAIVVQAGSIGGLFASLSHRREALAGQGPVFGAAYVGLIGVCFYLLHAPSKLTSASRGWAILSAISYFSAVFIGGSKAFFLYGIIAMLVCSLGRRRIPVALVITVLAAFVAFSAFYQSHVRQYSYDQANRTHIDTTSASAAARSAWAQFVDNGVDELRTTSAAAKSAGPWAAHPDYQVRAILTVVPRFVWPNKPDGAAIEFSQTFFPLSWSRGTGIPPSLFAEMIWSYGLVGGAFATLCVGAVLGRLQLLFARSKRVLMALVQPIFVVSAFLLVKAGSDSALRLAFELLLSCAIFMGVAKVCYAQSWHRNMITFEEACSPKECRVERKG